MKKSRRTVIIAVLYGAAALLVVSAAAYLQIKSTIVSLHDDVRESRMELDYIYEQSAEMLNVFLRKSSYYPLREREARLHEDISRTAEKLQKAAAGSSIIEYPHIYQGLLDLQDRFFLLLKNNRTIPAGAEADSAMLTLLRYRNYFESAAETYNERVDAYNSVLKTFPANVIAAHLEFSPYESFPLYFE